ncbi:Sugar transferase involved in LPS biosynthesis (colanic, teichoic acid) [Robiginitalea myxolifaciens]|uniref:Sugar transferase involved in LPS biosynthesis (Colanic, teichoic acid) n=1 Tax=Robiginitalea myxolifaciens TaxID=400055 RepID=A0A1I6H2A0_9FLAO|nr:sugar transferase [Robiginitalea myxolifaciens]SFR48457.1 Sugar transferase involved in LPS biosynthesis (colanic, teichoic acid) [Robiginitalea myxolifaciens]
MYRKYFKRLIDLLISASMLLILSPILLLISILLYFANSGSVFFRQERPGKGEKIFRIIKFKTMNDKRDGEGKLLPDSKRLTPVGRIIRKTSLDEVPQLINVFKGDMSLIGPRPLLPKYLPFYTEKERLRHTVLPGITGLAQVSGRNLLDWDERLQKDAEYVEKLSFPLDIKIIIQTVINVIRSKDNVADPSSIMLDLDEQRGQAKMGHPNLALGTER